MNYPKSMLEELPKDSYFLVKDPASIGKKYTNGAIDFESKHSIATPNLEKCIAIVTFNKQTGTIGHFTPLVDESDIFPYFSWIRSANPPDTSAFIVGGVKDESEELATQLHLAAMQYKFNIAGADLFGDQRRNILLLKEGTLMIEYFKQQMDSEHELHDVPTGKSRMFNFKTGRFKE